MSEGGVGNDGERARRPRAPMAPFDVWTQWLKSNMGEVMAPPGVSVPWLVPAGINTGEEAESLPEGAIRNDPMLQVVEQLWNANPLQNVLPINWVEITRALQTLWAREMSDPAAAAQRAAEYNRRFFETTMEVWSDATARFWGLPQQERKRRRGRTSASPGPSGRTIPSTRRSRSRTCSPPNTC